MSNNKWNDAKIIKEVRRRIVDKLILVGEFVEGDAKLRCPVDTGNLRNSINYKVDEEELSVKIGTNVDYAPYVELGTSKQKAQPFLVPSLVENENEIKTILNL
jgi:HK97 gp10 family phage protein